MAVRQAKQPRAENKSNKIVKSKNKSENKVLLIAQEIKFAKTLAGNDKKARDKVLKNLKKWLTYRSASTFEFSEQDFMRLWKGLFYCVWMSDKPLIQEDLCESISQLFECFGDEKMETSALFYKCFLKTMANDWFGIDQHRIDKFLMLVRRMTRGILRCGQRLQWSPHALTCLNSSLGTLLAENQGLGLQMHLADLWMEEVAKITEGKISPETVAELTKPFAEYLCYGQETRLAGSIMRHIFTHLIRQTDLGIDYQEKMFAWRHAGYPGGSVDAMEKVEESDEEEEVGEEPEQESDDDESGQPKRKVGLDARAGHVDAVLPQLPVDGHVMATMFKDMISDARSTLNNRTKLNSLVQSFETLATGEYPYKMKDVTMPNDPKYRLPKAGKSAIDLMVFEELHEDDEMKGMNKRQRRKFLMKQRKTDEAEEKDEDQPRPKAPSAPKKAKKDINAIKVQPGVWQVEDVKESEDIRPDSSKNTTIDEKILSVKKNPTKKLAGNRLNISDSNVLKSQKNRLNILKSNLSLSSSPSRKSKKNTAEDAIDFLKTVKPSSETPAKETEDIRLASSKNSTLEEKDNSAKKNRNKKIEKILLNTSDSDLIKSKKNRLKSLKSNLSISASPSRKESKKNTTEDAIDFLKSVKQTPETSSKQSEDIRLDTGKTTTLEKKISPDKKNQSKKTKPNDLDSSVVLKSQKSRLNILKLDLSLSSTPTPSSNKELIALKSSTPKVAVDSLKIAKQSFETPAKKSEDVKPDSAKSTKLDKKNSPINKNQAKKMGLNRLNTSDSNILKSQKNRLNILKSNLSLSASPSPSRKKVLIALKNNTSQGVIDYFKSVKQSPEIPFDGEKKPPKTALKPNTLPSPINPFYKKKLRLKF